MKSKNQLILLLIYTLAAGISGPAGAAPACVRFISIPEGATVMLKSSVILSSSTPATICTLEPGMSYLLQLEKPGYETRTLNFTPSQEGSLFNFSGRQAGCLLRSAVVPGWGQVSRGGYLRGIEAFLSSTAAGLFIYVAYKDYTDERDRYNFFRRAAEAAEKERGKIQYLADAHAASKSANVKRQHTVEFTAFGGWVYAGNLMEIFLMSCPPKVVSIEESSATLKIPQKSRARALMRSILFPGLGQKYIGEPFKGFLFQGTFFTVAALALKAKRDYDLATVHYELAAEALNAADTVDEVEAARVVLSEKWDTRRDEEQKRNVFYIAAASIWFLNVLDASISAGNIATENRFGFETSFHPYRIRAGFRIGF